MRKLLLLLLTCLYLSAWSQPGDPTKDPDVNTDTVKVKSEPKLSFAIANMKRPKKTFKRKIFLFSSFTVTAILLTKKEEKE